MSLVLTENNLAGLFYIQRYRFLTTPQFAKIAGLRYDTASSNLRRFERMGILGHTGNVPLAGHGKTPKAYHLTRKGHALLVENLEHLKEQIGGYKKTKTDAKWSPQMFHRLRTVDALIEMELACIERQNLEVVAVLLEYKKAQLPGGGIRKETTDFIAEEETAENRIIPDAAFVIERKDDGKRFLFFLELDNGTETIVSRVPANFSQSVQYKYTQYEKYLKSGRWVAKYAPYGDFRFFTMLFVTTAQKRAENVRDSLGFLDDALRPYFYISTLENTETGFFNNHWFRAEPSNMATQALIK